MFNSGTINAATGAAAIEFCSCGLDYALTLGPGSAIDSTVVGNGIATLQLGGSGKDTFDLGLIGVQYVNFGNFNSPQLPPGPWSAPARRIGTCSAAPFW